MKLLIIILTFMLVSSGVMAHSLNGVYKCKTSSWSPFKTKVEIKNFKKHYDVKGKMFYSTSEVYFDDTKISKPHTYDNRHYIEDLKNKSIFIFVVHNTSAQDYDLRTPPTEGIKYIHQEKEFSEKSGSKWVKKRSVFCEPQ